MKKISLEEQNESGAVDTNLESDNRAIRCPRCGSHTLRSFGVEKAQASLKCLTCGKEFTRPAMPNPESKTAEQAHKHVPGTRVQMTHPNYKSERGSVVDYSGKHADLGEEQYEIQLDSGEKITNIPESAFKRIKSAGFVSNKTIEHVNGTANHFIESMTFQAAPSGPPGDAKKPKMIPLTEWDDNKTKEDYDPDRSDPRYDEPEWEETECPMCNGPGNHIGDLGARSYFRCRNCGMDFSHFRDDESSKWDYDNDPNNLFGQDKPGQMPTSARAKRTDTHGNKLEAGRVYLMKGKDYTVPDLVRILNLEESRIEAAIASDAKGAFPIIIEAKDEDEYHFDPVNEGEEKTERSGGWKVAKRNWSAKEQRELIEENVKGRARNIDKLDLSGTHYELKSASEDPDFLWQ
jgi:DNA-directed RNA polymerase subunit RPC12/RpoP